MNVSAWLWRVRLNFSSDQAQIGNERERERQCGVCVCMFSCCCCWLLAVGCSLLSLLLCTVAFAKFKSIHCVRAYDCVRKSVSLSFTVIPFRLWFSSVFFSLNLFSIFSFNSRWHRKLFGNDRLSSQHTHAHFVSFSLSLSLPLPFFRSLSRSQTYTHTHARTRSQTKSKIGKCRSACVRARVHMYVCGTSDSC